MSCYCDYDKLPKPNRAAADPGGCECVKCGRIFIGAEHHDECGVCASKGVEQPNESGAQDCPHGVDDGACDLGVGCYETGICYAMAHGQPDQCGAASALTLSEQHTDDLAVDSFARAMKEKMAAARAKGRSGWEGMDPSDLSRMLREHVEKGDPRDVANFCMMLWHHSAQIAQQPQTAEPKGMTDGPSFTNPLTPYGMLVRALRIVAGTTLYDMAQALLTTPAKLSAMEFGRAPVTQEFAFDVSAYFDALGVPNTQQALAAALLSKGE